MFVLQKDIKPRSQVKCNSDMIRSTGGCYSGWGSDWRRAFGWVGGLGRLSCSRFIADNRLHHECILKVTDVVAVLRLALVDASVGDTAVQAVRVFSIT